MSKKSSKSAPKEVASYAERDIVLGKVRGFPPWPGMVVDPDSVPQTVQKERPGKKSNFYCVQFFPTGDYAWLVAKDISKLQPVEIEAYINEPYKKSGDLLQGYRTAQDPTAWEAQRAESLAAAAASDDGEGEGEDIEEDVDELASEDGEKKKPAPKSRKRKRESLEPKTRKTPKEREREKEKKERPVKAVKAPAKGRKSSSKSKALVESEDDRERAGEEEGAEDAEGEEVGVASGSKKDGGSPPPAKKARREEEPDDAAMQADPEAIKVRDWRHKLQKAFLSSKNTPDDADMPALDALFSTVEAYDSITVAYLQFSKIGKVMRHITLLEGNRIPRDAEFRFKDRAQALVERWQSVLGAAKEGGGAAEKRGSEKVEKEKKEAVNGTKEVNGSASANGEENAVAEGAAKIDLNGAGATTGADAHADADMAAPTDADAPGEADGDADVSGQADAPGEAEDIAMTEA